MSDRNSSHRRYNPLLDEWVLCSPGRLKWPWQRHSEVAALELSPAYDPDRYLCPGNLRAKGARNPAYANTLAFDNHFPALAAASGTKRRGAPKGLDGNEFVVGCELSAEPQRDFLPEEAAERLRAMRETSGGSEDSSTCAD